MEIFETIIVILVVGLVGAVVAYKTVRFGKGEGGGCGSCNCGKDKADSGCEKQKKTV